jgi:hypothetical protein
VSHTSTATGHLRRYDATSGQKSERINSGICIDQTRVSGDGAWILFLSIPNPRAGSQHRALLQLVRLDGRYSSRLPISLPWSVNQPLILLSLNTNNDTSQFQLLTVASGALQPLFLEQSDQFYD